MDGDGGGGGGIGGGDFTGCTSLIFGSRSSEGTLFIVDR